MRGLYEKLKEKFSRHGDKRLPKASWAISPVRRAVMIVCACAFLISAAWLTLSIVDYYRGEQVYGDITEDAFLDSDISYAEKVERMKDKLTQLKAENSDIYGYIHIGGTRISFPVVKGEDNEYYLKRAYNGQFMVCGAIYADYRVNDDFESNRNITLYGHNMLDGNMFNNVMLFLAEDVFNSKLIEIYTIDGVYIYEPFSIFKTTYDEPYFRMDFASDEEFVAFCEEMQSSSIHNKTMTFTGEDKIITLSTCTPSTDLEYYYVGRYALHAKLIRIEK